MNKVIINGVEYAPIGKPRPLLADAKVGDLCKRRDGKYVQIIRIDTCHKRPYRYRDNEYGGDERGVTVAGSWICDDNGKRSFDIIATEPLAEEGSAEWAWQMMLLGKDITHCEYTHSSDKWRMTNGTASCLAGMSADTKEKWLQNAIGNGWQLYEPQPEPEFNVGDFVKYDIDTYLRVIEPSGKDKTLCKTLSGVIVYPYTSCLTKASPSEVIVKIGCLEGTVRKYPNARFRLINGVFVSIIDINMLDTPTRELVESLLRAQEEK